MKGVFIFQLCLTQIYKNKTMIKIITMIGALFFGASVWSQYCVPDNGSYGCNVGHRISDVTFGTISNLNSGCSGGGTAGYGNFTTQNTTIYKGQSYTANVTVASSVYVSLYFDWNQDFDFDDAGEKIDAATETYSSGTAVITVNVPLTASSGNTRMRVRGALPQFTVNGCDNVGVYSSGETEDYTVNIVGSGSALNFSGLNTVVGIGSSINTVLDGSNTITAEAWVNADNITGDGVIVGNYENGGGDAQFLLRRDGGFYTFWVRSSTTAFTNVTSSVAVAPGVWQHVAGTWDGTTIRIYVDGVLAGTTSYAGTNLLNYSSPISIGGRQGFEYFAGSLDEVRIWNTTRTQCEINTYKDCEIPTTEIGLQANYHFNQGFANQTNYSVTSLNDAAGTNTGTLFNFPLSNSSGNWVAPGAFANGFSTPANLIPTVTAAATIDTLCLGGSTTLSGAGATTYSWTGGISDATSFAPTATAFYTVTGTNTTSGCSSIADQLVVVNTPSTGTDIQTACTSYDWIDGNTYTASNNAATFTLTNAAGCDSVVTLNLTINNPSIATTVSGITITATQAGATYQWIDCATGSTIAGATTQSYTATTNGSYSVIIAQNGCSDTSNCVTIANVGIETTNQLNLSIYPNPTKGEFTLATDKIGASISILSLDGKIIFNNQLITANQTICNLANFEKGVYFLKVNQNGIIRTERIVLN
jgi:Concanavalin A-like lectin/glucanases superfamily/GEVED domain/Secretion system C-terminal sorting domain